jgi:CubicO group peptidase (beta-lactamase class C family)
VANSDGVIFEAGFGIRDVATGAPMAADTVVWIASMTKAVTGACAMQLVEQGRLSLDGPIAAVLPELGKVQVLEGFTADGSPRLRPARRPITLRHLLTHTSGFVYDIWNPEMGRYLETTSTPGIISCANAALSIPLVFDPGERHRLGRQGGRGRQRPASRCLYAAEPAPASRHGGHGVQDRSRATATPGEGA